jgi:alkyl sulfatase BDS1-like metallo-beta-lactamase superfamily hydrolase
VRQTLEGLNAGLAHEEILASIQIPEQLAGEPYLDALYDRPEFIARNVIRKYGGWWNGFSAQVMPARMEDQAKEVARLAGGVEPLIRRAREVVDSSPALACHLAEWAGLAAPEDRDAQQCVIDVFGRRADAEISLMGRGILSHAVRKAGRALAALDGEG